MKKFAVILLFSLGLALNGCGNSIDSEKSNIQNETMSETDETENYYTPTNETPETQEKNITTTVVEQGGPYGKISISLPAEWSYETYPIDSNALSLGMYGIRFYPKEVTNGYIELVYTDSFGVCGTGLDSKTATIAGDSVTIGTYDNHNYWDFISFNGKNNGIVALTNSVDGWYNEQSEQILHILDTLSFNQDIKEGGAYVYNVASEVSEIALSFSLKDIFPTGATLVFNQYDADAPAGELTYDDDYVIEIQKDGNWEKAPLIIEDYGINSIAYTIPTESISEHKLNWNWLYGSLAPGNYRIRKTIHDFREAGNYDEHIISAYFILN